MSTLMAKITALAKRRGFIFPSSEIYGGIKGFWDYGPLGVRLKNNLQREWWRAMVEERDDVYPLETTIIHHPQVWQASGHTLSFTDPLQECQQCHQRFRADKIKNDQCQKCGGKLTAVKQFNLMFSTQVGSAQETANKVYLRPETCQGIFINFKNVLDTVQPKLPFGISQIGKGFRNEITTGNFIFRDREFSMMELEYFVRPGEDEQWFEYWLKARMKFHLNLGLKKKNLRFYEHPQSSLAHYSKRTVDIEYHYPFGWSELEGIANRTDFDLKNHSRVSGVDLSYQDDQGKKFYPYVIEPSLGVERLFLALLSDAYHEEDKRLVLRLSARLAPFQTAVFPLLANKPELAQAARKVYELLRPHLAVAWDDRGNIGKRYYSQDEIGTPFCVTIDFQTLKDQTVTVRRRDTTQQDRLVLDKLLDYFQNKLTL